MIELLPLSQQYCMDVAEIAEECLPEHWSLESIRDVLRYDYNIYYVAHAVEEDRIVGFAGIMVIEDVAEMLNIAVCPGYRRQGIGQMLVEKMLMEAFFHDAKRLLLEVRKGNESARRLYSRNAFLQLSERRAYYDNPVEDAIIMERKLIDLQ